MRREDFDGGLSNADRWGCAAAFLVGTLVFAPLILVDALGDCAPDADCRKGFLLMVLLPSLIAAAVAGLLVRFLKKPR
jgi:hypothetical protein